MREWLGTQIERYEVPGAAVAVVAGGKIVLQEGFGRRDVEEDLPVTPDTSMALASATKAFTAATVGALVDDGLLDWDEPVRRHIPDFQLWDPVATERYCHPLPVVGEKPRTLALQSASGPLLCVSLTPIFNGFHYKVAATILGCD